LRTAVIEEEDGNGKKLITVIWSSIAFKQCTPLGA
jgi:hypothetical protein